jgi:NADPH:quinone reductase-like Zn-dependent oxidoreductase
VPTTGLSVTIITVTFLAGISQIYSPNEGKREYQPTGFKMYATDHGILAGMRHVLDETERRIAAGHDGVGRMGVQLAAARDATVIATAAERNHALLRGLGAVPVAYGPGPAGRIRAAAPRGISAALDFAGTDEALDVSLELVADRARIASITGPLRRAGAGIKLLGYGPGQDAGTEIRDAARGDLVERAGSGALRVIIDTTFPLADAAKAHEAGMAGHAPGKLALIP